MLKIGNWAEQELDTDLDVIVNGIIYECTVLMLPCLRGEVRSPGGSAITNEGLCLHWSTHLWGRGGGGGGRREQRKEERVKRQEVDSEFNLTHRHLWEKKTPSLT